MAEYVKGRMTAAKVGIGLALFGLAAGLVEKVRPQDSNKATLALARVKPAAVDAFIKFSDLSHKISEKQIKYHTLKLRDFAAHQVLSYKELAQIQKFGHELQTIKLTDAAIKGELNTIKGELGHTISGNGILISGAQSVPHTSSSQSVGADLLTVGNVVKVEAFNDDTGIYIKFDNLTSSALQLVSLPDTETLAPAGQPGSQSKTIKLDVKLGSMDPLTAQVFGDGQPPVTLTVSTVPVAGSQNNQFVAQALASTK